MADRTNDRIQHNNRVFREANEGIHRAAARYDHELERIPFLCECPEEDCVEILRLSEEEYAEIRANPQHYMTAVGHETAEQPVGQVVARNNGYVIVEKG
jgi:hypothetical protein